MTDIVERLRARRIPTSGEADPDCHDAADEIERLRAELEAARLALKSLVASTLAREPKP
jgi:hypothetical protein